MRENEKRKITVKLKATEGTQQKSDFVLMAYNVGCVSAMRDAVTACELLLCGIESEKDREHAIDTIDQLLTALSNDLRTLIYQRLYEIGANESGNGTAAQCMTIETLNRLQEPRTDIAVYRGY